MKPRRLQSAMISSIDFFSDNSDMRRLFAASLAARAANANRTGSRKEPKFVRLTELVRFQSRLPRGLSHDRTCTPVTASVAVWLATKGAAHRRTDAVQGPGGDADHGVRAQGALGAGDAGR